MTNRIMLIFKKNRQTLNKRNIRFSYHQIYSKSNHLNNKMLTSVIHLNMTVATSQKKITLLAYEVYLFFRDYKNQSTENTEKRLVRKKMLKYID